MDQVPARGIEQVKEWYAEFPVKASACVECGVGLERCPFDVEIIAYKLLFSCPLIDDTGYPGHQPM